MLKHFESLWIKALEKCKVLPWFLQSIYLDLIRFPSYTHAHTKDTFFFSLPCKSTLINSTDNRVIKIYFCPRKNFPTIGTFYFLYPTGIWKTSGLCCMMKWSKISNFDQESQKADSVFAKCSLKIQASSTFEIKPSALLVDLNYMYEVRCFWRESRSYSFKSL